MSKNMYEKFFDEHRALSWVIASLIFIIVFAVAMAMSSCNVTRTVTTTAEHYQRGDTTVTIMTKTTESYDGTVKRDAFK